MAKAGGSKSKSGRGSSGGSGGGASSSKKTPKKVAKKVAKKAAKAKAAKKASKKSAAKKAAKKAVTKKAATTAAPKKASGAAEKRAKAAAAKTSKKAAGGSASAKAAAGSGGKPKGESASRRNGKSEEKASTGSAPKAKTGSSKERAAKDRASKDQPAKADTAPAAGTKPAADSAGGDGEAKKPVRKGITIVSKRPAGKKRATKATPTFKPPTDRLLGPGSKYTTPLIPSGPKPEDGADELKKRGTASKSPFSKAELDEFAAILRQKRAELMGDVSHMEEEALTGGSGDLSHTPQHLAEQGSDSYDRALSLDLAAADRRLIREIDEALERIAAGKYGICELTGKAIKKVRLRELPWARYSIDAARALERSGGGHGP